MLERVGGVLGDVGRVVRSCHERWDGAGYPDRLTGEHIPLVARIVCACDAFSAMTTDRPYRKARPHDEALAELRRCGGIAVRPAVVEALGGRLAGAVAGRDRAVRARKRAADDRRRHAVPDLAARTRGEDRRLHASRRVDGGPA